MVTAAVAMNEKCEHKDGVYLLVEVCDESPPGSLLSAAMKVEIKAH